jgi:phage terminase small subunit
MPLLEGYAEAIVLCRQANAELAQHGAVLNGKASPWLTVQEKATRAMVALSMRLRLSPQARLEGRNVARMKPDQVSAYDSAELGHVLKHNR